MKALIFSALAAGVLALSAGDAKADHWRSDHHRAYHSHYRPYWGGYRYRPYYSGYYRPYWRYYGYPYVYGYPYAYSYYGYPGYGVGYVGPNVGVWFGW